MQGYCWHLRAWSSRNGQEENRHLETLCSPALLRSVDGWKGEVGKCWRECCSVCLLPPINGRAGNSSLGCKSFHLRPKLWQTWLKSSFLSSSLPRPQCSDSQALVSQHTHHGPREAEQKRLLTLQSRVTCYYNKFTRPEV